MASRRVPLGTCVGQARRLDIWGGRRQGRDCSTDTASEPVQSILVLHKWRMPRRFRGQFVSRVVGLAQAFPIPQGVLGYMLQRSNKIRAPKRYGTRESSTVQPD